MEMEGWLSLCFVGLSTVLALLFLKLSRGKSNPRKTQLPPGPWTLPFIGSLHHVARVLPHRKLMEMSRRYGPLMHLRLGEVPTVVVSSAEAAALVMKSNDLAFASRPRSLTQDVFGCGGKGIGFAPYGEHWRQMRKLCIVELLSATQVKRMEGIRAEEVGNLLRSIATSASASPAAVNVSHMVMSFSNNVVSQAVFGAKFLQQEEYLRELGEALELVSGFCLVDLFPSSRLVRWLSNGERRTKRTYSRIQRIFADIIKARKATRAASDGSRNRDEEDLLDVLLRLQEDESLAFPMTTEVIGALLFDIFAASTDTTATVFEWAMSELMNNPEAMAKTQLEIREVLGENRAIITNGDIGELHYMRMVIKEVLRLHPPAPLIPRMTREDCTIMGYDILEGTNIFVNVFTISRDPRYWKNPDEFKPERFEDNNINYNGTYFEFIPFGAGRRQCPGILFGTSTVEIALANFLYHFDWMLPDGIGLASFDMSEKFRLTVSKRCDLKLKAIPHTCFNVMW